MPEITRLSKPHANNYHLQLKFHNRPFNDIPGSHSPLGEFKKAGAYISWPPKEEITLQNKALLLIN